MTAITEKLLAADSFPVARKPRIMIAGEFSAGKSRLINSLVGKDILPSNVTSTALPPMWLVGDGQESLIVGLDGTVSDFNVDEIDIKSTLFCVLSAKSPILNHVDLIDTPGNSDPNIPSECWERMVQFADGLIWCTSAMQAWKQTEKATCSDLPEDLRAQASLLITQADRMPDEKSAEKVLRRVTRDASKYFEDVMMGSMLNADDVERISARIIAMSEGLPLRGVASEIVDRVRAVESAETAEDKVVDTKKKADAEPANTSAAPDASETPEAPAKKVAVRKVVTRTVVGPWSLIETTDASETEAETEAEAEETAEASVEAPEEVAAEKEVQAAEVVAEEVVEAEETAETDMSFGMTNGTVAELWSELTEDQDLSDNERFLKCVASLLSEVQQVLSKPAEVLE